MTDIETRVRAFFEAYPIRTYQKGEHLILANENPAGIYYIVSGQVREYDVSNNGDELVVNLIKHPAFFPMSWAISGVPNTYFFQAVDDTTVHVAPADDVIKLLKKESDVTYDLLERVLRGTDGLLARLARVMATNAHDRVLLELTINAKRFGHPQTDGSVRLHLTTQELAARTGLARETVSRELSKLRRDNFLDKDEDGILIPSVAALEALY